MAAPLGLETREQRVIFVTYMSLWVSYGLLNELAKRQAVHFNSTSAVVMQSLLKLGIAAYMYLTNEAVTIVVANSPRHANTTNANTANVNTLPPLSLRLQALAREIGVHRSLLVQYFVPAGLYVLYDVLSYVNLRQFDAPTYFLLLQFRMVITGVLHQFMFQRRLNRNQWISLVVTTLGCAVKTIGDQRMAANNGSTQHVGPSLFAYGLLLVQMLSSTFAGVYNEVLLKKQVQIPLNLQNLFMYMDSLLCTTLMLVLGLTGQSFAQVVAPSSLAVLFSIYVLPMVLIMSCIGVVTSMFLKALDSVRKAIASALELVVLPLLAALLFGIPLTSSLALSVALVGSGVYIYSLPVTDRSVGGSGGSNGYSAVPKKADDLESGDGGGDSEASSSSTALELELATVNVHDEQELGGRLNKSGPGSSGGGVSKVSVPTGS